MEGRPGLRGKPDRMPSQCIACGACGCDCAASALTSETGGQRKTRTRERCLGRCIYCGRCEEVGPTRAIQLTNNFKLSVTSNAYLYT
ncbi:hypothetical protein, partial [Escherichia coli]|uniref:hypothetical protein n=1 Tax=Escherichia coli TaxID=562 RepID=UPI001BC8391F